MERKRKADELSEFMICLELEKTVTFQSLTNRFRSSSFFSAGSFEKEEVDCQRSNQTQ